MLIKAIHFDIFKLLSQLPVQKFNESKTKNKQKFQSAKNFQVTENKKEIQ